MKTLLYSDNCFQEQTLKLLTISFLIFGNAFLSKGRCRANFKDILTKIAVFRNDNVGPCLFYLSVNLLLHKNEDMIDNCIFLLDTSSLPDFC